MLTEGWHTLGRGDDDDTGLTAETVAGMILANVPSGHLDAVRAITAYRIALGGDEDATAFWEEVLTLLGA
jgi:hypothetical protein